MRDQRHASIIVDLNFRMSDDENIELMMATRGKGSIIIINENEKRWKNHHLWLEFLYMQQLSWMACLKAIFRYFKNNLCFLFGGCHAENVKIIISSEIRVHYLWLPLQSLPTSTPHTSLSLSLILSFSYDERQREREQRTIKSNDECLSPLTESWRKQRLDIDEWDFHHLFLPPQRHIYSSSIYIFFSTIIGSRGVCG